jgi:cytochrome c6
MKKSAIYAVCIAFVTALGILGGFLVFPGISPAAPDKPQDGEKLYTTHCGGCHPNGGNTITPDLPVIGSPKLKNPDIFAKFNRNPLKTDGSKGIMPAFANEKVSDQEMKQIYQYIVKMRPTKK